MKLFVRVCSIVLVAALVIGILAIALYTGTAAQYKLLKDKVKNMAVTLNSDEKVVNVIKEGLKKTGGYCPYRRERIPETKCMCKEFREQIADPDFEGYCHCMLYYKTKG